MGFVEELISSINVSREIYIGKVHTIYVYKEGAKRRISKHPCHFARETQFKWKINSYSNSNKCDNDNNKKKTYTTAHILYSINIQMNVFFFIFNLILKHFPYLQIPKLD